MALLLTISLALLCRHAFAHDEIKSVNASITDALNMTCSDVTDHVILAAILLSPDEGEGPCYVSYRDMFPNSDGLELVDEVQECILKTDTCFLSAGNTLKSKPMTCVKPSDKINHWSAWYTCVPKHHILNVNDDSTVNLEWGTIVTIHSKGYPHYSPRGQEVREFTFDSTSRIEVLILDLNIDSTSNLTLYAYDAADHVTGYKTFHDEVVTGNQPVHFVLKGVKITVYLEGSGYSCFSFLLNATQLDLPTTDGPTPTTENGAITATSSYFRAHQTWLTVALFGLLGGMIRFRNLR